MRRREAAPRSRKAENAARALEDLGYFCVDNFPPQLMEQFLAEFTHLWGRIPGFALGIDIRAREFFEVAIPRAKLA